MNSEDLTLMLGNLSQSLLSVQRLITGFAYLLGMVFIFISLQKLKKVANFHPMSPSQEKIFVPMAYMLFGAALLFLPSAIKIMANSAFGVGNVLSYASYKPYNVLDSMGIIIVTMGIVWFIRGCVLLAHASQPGVQEGPKGLMFVCAGVLAINFDNTVAMINTLMRHFTDVTLALKDAKGY